MKMTRTTGEYQNYDNEIFTIFSSKLYDDQIKSRFYYFYKILLLQIVMT